MANSSLTLSSLDFDTLKNNLKKFLSSQDIFKDYNFEGSNINVLLDVLSYNSYLNSFYLNMIASEMFLDSAQKYDSIVSHAKELNYVPRSASHSVADISFTLETKDLNNKLTIPKGTKFYGTNSNGTFNFVTDQISTYVSVNDTFSVANLLIKEGSYFQDSYIMNYDLENQRFLISNKNIDISSISVNVSENYGANVTEFQKVNTLYNLDTFSNVYFIQAAENNLYEITFGDGLFGRRPLNEALITVKYIITNGSDGNGVKAFSLSDDLGFLNGGTANPSTITVNRESQGGANQESIESVRFTAPRYFATQQRAVSSDDYASLVLANFGGEIGDVAVYGGETTEPKKYGRVIICLKPSSGVIAPNYVKNKVVNYLRDYIVIPNRVLISDPEYMYIWMNSIVEYNIYKTDKSPKDIQSIVINTITDFSENNLEKFNKDLRYSRLVADIDNCDISISSNQSDIRVIKRIAPKMKYPSTYLLDINNPIDVSGDVIDNQDLLENPTYEGRFDVANIISSRFDYITSKGDTYSICYIEDHGEGVLSVYSIINSILSKIEDVGTVDYKKGILKINNIRVFNFERYISIYCKTIGKDVLANKTKIIIIDPVDLNINVRETSY